MATVEDSETVVATIPSRQKVSRLEKNALARRDEAKAFKITSIAKYNGAADFALSIKEMEATVGELYDPHVKAAHAMHKGLTDARKKLLDPLVEARTLVQRSMSDWTREQTRLAQVAADEAARLEREEELKAAKKIKNTAERKEVVEELKAAPVVAERVEISVPKVSGVVAKKVVLWRLANLGDTSKIPRQFLMLNESAIKAYVKLHGMDAKIAGIEVYEDVQTQIR